MTTTYTNYRLITADIDRSIERISQQPQVQRETDYYLSKIGDIKSIDDFMSDDRIYNYAMKAFGLEDMTYAKAFMRKVLTEGIDTLSRLTNSMWSALHNVQPYLVDGCRPLVLKDHLSEKSWRIRQSVAARAPRTALVMRFATASVPLLLVEHRPPVSGFEAAR